MDESEVNQENNNNKIPEIAPVKISKKSRRKTSDKHTMTPARWEAVRKATAAKKLKALERRKAKEVEKKDIENLIKRRDRLSVMEAKYDEEVKKLANLPMTLDSFTSSISSINEKLAALDSYVRNMEERHNNLELGDSRLKENIRADGERRDKYVKQEKLMEAGMNAPPLNDNVASGYMIVPKDDGEYFFY